QMKLRPSSYVPELRNRIGDELLKVHVSYGPLVQQLLKQFNVVGKPLSGPKVPLSIKGLAHITGGGFVDNIPRVLPKNCDVLIRKGSWTVPPIFQLLQQRGNTSEAELYQVFNMGIGMALIIAAEKLNAILKFIRARQYEVWAIGEVVKGRGQ